jgi:hypothetical protein
MHVVAIVLSAASYLSLLVGIAILVRKDPATC